MQVTADVNDLLVWKRDAFLKIGDPVVSKSSRYT